MSVPQHICMVYYYENQWAKWLSICSDQMCATYADWLFGAERDSKKWEQSGQTVHKVYIDVEMFQGKRQTKHPSGIC